MKRWAVVAIAGAVVGVVVLQVRRQDDDVKPTATRDGRARELRETPDLELPILVYAELSGPDDASIERRTIWLTEYANFEVGNGGFVQYFFNTRGEYASETLAALERIGAQEHLEVFRTAIEQWETEQPMFEAAGDDIEAFSELYEQSSLTELDEAWLQMPIEHAEARWIRSHLDAFDL